MILLIWMLIALVNNWSCYATSDENVYIDALVQKYLTDEKLLWNGLYANRSNDASHRNVHSIRHHISNFYSDVFDDTHLNFVMSFHYMSKFVDYMDFYNLQTYIESNQQDAFDRGDLYLTFDRTFSAYNPTRFEEKYSEILQGTQDDCTSWSTEMESGRQKLYMFYEILSANLLTSYMKSQKHNMEQVIKDDFRQHDFEKLRSGFVDMYNALTATTKFYLQRASRPTWQCDQNITADATVGDSREITNFLQGYVDNQINLNNEQSCWGSCSDYKFARNHGCYSGTFCEKKKKTEEDDRVPEIDRKCSGQIIDCMFIEDKMEICPSRPGRNRRYEYINYGCTPTDRMRRTRCLTKGRFFGQSGECGYPLGNTTQGNTTQDSTQGNTQGNEQLKTSLPHTLQSFRNDWLVTCNYCFCYCDEQNVASDRYFSLRPVLSDYRANMVISAIKIEKQNGIFSFNILQSEMMSYGRVAQLQPANNSINENFNRSDGVEGEDYHRLSWQNRSVNLDTIVLPRGSVVTGVRFVVKRGSIGLEVQATQFDFYSGTLFDRNNWIGSENTGDRSNVHIERPEPNRYCDEYGAYLSIPDFRPNMLVKFRPSDPDKDAGQTTVPFIDTQWVKPEILTPLSGVALYYKGKRGLGGFIAPALVPYDMSSYIGNKLIS